ncbi:MAG: CdaR family protein [Flavobacteriales bacterium]
MPSLRNFLKDRLSRKLNVFLVCLLISSIIWLLIALSKDYSTVIRFPVDHKGFPENRIVTDPPPRSLYLEVHSHGFELLAYKFFSRKQPITVDMEELRFRDPKKERNAYLPTRELLDKFSRQFPENTRIRDVNPDTLFVSLAPKAKKKVKVLPELDLAFREQFRLAEKVEVSPSKVTLKGPSSVLDTTFSVKTHPLELQDVHKDQRHTVKVNTDSLSEKVEAKPSSVELRIRVNEFTEGKVKVLLQPKKVPEKYKLITYPDSVTVHYLVGLENYEKVKRDMFKATVRFPDDKGMKEKNYLRVKLTEHPSFVDIIRSDPERVEFIIRKRE